MFLKSVKNVFDMIIGPVEFRKQVILPFGGVLSLESTILRLNEGFLLQVNFKKIENTQV